MNTVYWATLPDRGCDADGQYHYIKHYSYRYTTKYTRSLCGLVSPQWNHAIASGNKELATLPKCEQCVVLYVAEVLA